MGAMIRFYSGQAIRGLGAMEKFGGGGEIEGVQPVRAVLPSGRVSGKGLCIRISPFFSPCRNRSISLQFVHHLEQYCDV